jgi:hypothetical protein
MSDIKQLLLKRRVEVAAKLPALEVTRDKHRGAWMEAIAALTATKQELEKIDLALKTLEDAEAKSAQPTIMNAVLEVLKQQPEGMTALEILDEINSRYFNGKYVRTSLSPQLSRLKDRDRKITLRGNRWYLLAEEPSLFTPKS